MPLMPRFKSKGSKVAYAILGTPANLMKHRSNQQSTKVNRRLIVEETRLVR